MIPSFCPSDVPPGEKAVYSAFQGEDNTRDWTILHSLGIANHIRQVQGESDFVFIVPGSGVLVVEVKSHLTVGRDEDGTWTLGNDKPTSRGPFQQANEAMHSILKFLDKQKLHLEDVPVLFAVWFTGVRARALLPKNPEWHDWQVLDITDLNNPRKAILNVLAAGSSHLGSKVRRFSTGLYGPDSAKAKSIASVLRPKFELATVGSDRRRDREANLNSFVEEQYLALDSASDNLSMLFYGPAGSGKTFLAQESARREASLDRQGRLLCYNRLLGTHLAQQMKGVKGLTTGTLHQELLRISGLDRVPENATPSFWNEELPERALENILNTGDKYVGDFLVVDEIQDIAKEPLLDVLDAMVDGGLQNGRLLFYGDFERQAIYTNKMGRGLLFQRSSQMSQFKLVMNCRNVPRIGYQTNMLTKLQPGYSLFRREDDGIDPEIRKYKRAEDQTAFLSSAIRKLKAEGYSLDEIVVLSPLRDMSAAAQTTDPWLRQILSFLGDSLETTPGKVRYSTIHAFKGLEAPVVILTDLDHRHMRPHVEALLYVALTRATDRLIAFADETTLKNLIGKG
ncbi:nuclease [Arthrobacter sp. MYb214]|uniref:nuclease-related domain-containing DEAD/DEAH box helicase n=1 Tax=Arthrobacter sp. MYb214 TaxID=1848596 RepID=UPI000CFD129A|nr:ATP-binding domain-containing protein [Arthrobacter sp. MYb214]PRB76090.1 nuclease [Arthrobacter sp. MYb214]